MRELLEELERLGLLERLCAEGLIGQRFMNYLETLQAYERHRKFGYSRLESIRLVSKQMRCCRRTVVNRLQALGVESEELTSVPVLRMAA